MQTQIYNNEKVNKISLSIGWIAVILGGIIQYLYEFSFKQMVIVYALGLMTYVIPTLIYLKNKNSFIMRYFTSFGSFIYVFAILFFQHGLFDNIFYLFLALVSCSVFFDKYLSVFTSIFLCTISIIFYIFDRSNTFPNYELSNFINLCVVFIYIGVFLAFQGEWGKRMITNYILNKQVAERERLASLGELAGGVAHDINSPLSSIQGGLYLVNKLIQKYNKDGENMSPEKRDEIFRQIQEQIENSNMACGKIVNIVNSVRNHTRNLSGETIQDFYISNVVEDIKTLVHHQLKQSGCELIYEENEKYMISGDPGKLSQVLTNLIMNAAQAYGENSGEITVNTEQKGKKVVISVEDNAGGIPEHIKDGIFKNILTTKGTEGTGLGLYFSYSIITGHFGGEMWFESKEGKGTTFYIAVPMKKDDIKGEAV